MGVFAMEDKKPPRHTHTNYFKMPDLKRKHQSGIPLGFFLEANTYFNKTSHHVSY